MKSKTIVSVLICAFFAVLLPIPSNATISTNYPTKKIVSMSRLWDLGISSNNVVWSNRVSGQKRNSIYVYNFKTNKKTKIAGSSNPFNPIICGNNVYFWITKNFPNTGLYNYNLSTKKTKKILSVSRNQVEAKCSSNYITYLDDEKLYLYNVETKRNRLISNTISWTNRSWSLFSLNDQCLVYSESTTKGDDSILKVYNIKSKTTTLVKAGNDLVYEFGLYKYNVAYHLKSANKHKIMRYNIKTKKSYLVSNSSKVPYIQDFYGTKILCMAYSQNLPYGVGKLSMYDYRTKKKIAITNKLFKSQIKYPAKIYGTKIIWNAIEDKKSSIFITRI